MAERKVRGILTEAQEINCKKIGCLLRSDFTKNSQCQPKTVLDGYYPSKACERKKRVKKRLWYSDTRKLYLGIS